MSQQYKNIIEAVRNMLKQMQYDIIKRSHPINLPPTYDGMQCEENDKCPGCGCFSLCIVGYIKIHVMAKIERVDNTCANPDITILNENERLLEMFENDNICANPDNVNFQQYIKNKIYNDDSYNIFKTFKRAFEMIDILMNSINGMRLRVFDDDECITEAYNIYCQYEEGPNVYKILMLSKLFKKYYLSQALSEELAEYEEKYDDEKEIKKNGVVVGFRFECEDNSEPNKIFESECCVICMDNNPTHVMNPCGHKCICFDCLNEYQNNKTRANCPCCRKEVSKCVPQ